MSALAPRLCVVGPMLGYTPGRVTTQGQKLAELFSRSGYRVQVTSKIVNRYWRLADIAATLVRRRGEFDLVLLEVYSGRSFVTEDLAGWIGRSTGPGLILWLHGGAMPEFMARFPRWSRRVLSRGHAIVTPSPFLARAAGNHGLRAQVIPNILELDMYPFRLRKHLKPRLFWMRAFHPAYNPLMALRVLQRVRARFPDATLVMAGQNDGMEAEARRLAEELRIADAVTFPGFLGSEQKIRFGDTSDIFINTNHVDNMPVAVLEACAMGMPVVSTAVGGIPDLLSDGRDGLLVPDNDDRAMSESVERLLLDPGLSERLSSEGRRLAEQSSWTNVRPYWERLFDEVIGRQGAR